MKIMKSNHELIHKQEVGRGVFIGKCLALLSLSLSISLSLSHIIMPMIYGKHQKMVRNILGF